MLSLPYVVSLVHFETAPPVYPEEYCMLDNSLVLVTETKNRVLFCFLVPSSQVLSDFLRKGQDEPRDAPQGPLGGL
jgi:hypothetical protein